MVPTYYSDLITVLTWSVTTLGGLVVLLAAWGGRKVLDRLDNIERLLASENGKLLELIHDLDRRVLTIESHCQLYHQRGGVAARSEYDPAPVQWRHPE